MKLKDLFVKYLQGQRGDQALDLRGLGLLDLLLLALTGLDLAADDELLDLKMKKKN